jgi:hypothetical protein
MKENRAGRPLYEKPTVVSLGALAQGVGGCHAGSHAKGLCGGGSFNSQNCRAGEGATVHCGGGNQAKHPW